MTDTCAWPMNDEHGQSSECGLPVTLVINYPTAERAAIWVCSQHSEVLKQNLGG